MRQEELVLHHLREAGWLTAETALEIYGVRDLPKRISVLRGEGHRIDREFYTERGKRFARYSIERSAGST